MFHSATCSIVLLSRSNKQSSQKRCVRNSVLVRENCFVFDYLRNLWAKKRQLCDWPGTSYWILNHFAIHCSSFFWDHVCTSFLSQWMSWIRRILLPLNTKIYSCVALYIPAHILFLSWTCHKYIFLYLVLHLILLIFCQLAHRTLLLFLSGYW